MSRRLHPDDLYGIPQASDPQVSADGTRVAFVVTTAHRDSDTYRSNIHLATIRDGVVVQLTRGADDLEPRWSPDGRRLAFVSSRDGRDGAPQLWLLPADGGEARRLTDLPGGVRKVVWSPDGTRLAFLSTTGLESPRSQPDGPGSDEPITITRLNYKSDGIGLLGGRRQHLHVVDAERGDATQITDGDFWVEDPGWSPDGARLAFVADLHPERDMAPGPSLLAVGCDGGEIDRLCEDDGWTAAAPTWMPDGRSLVFVASRRARVGISRLVSVPAAGGAPKPLTPTFDRNVMVGSAAYPGAPPRIAAGGRTVVFCARDRGCTHVFTIPAEGGEPRRVVGGYERSVGGVTVAAASDVMAYVAATQDSPSEVFVASSGGDGHRQLSHLFSSAFPDVAPCSFEPRSFTSADGREVEGWLLRGAERGPLLLDIHGGPHNAWSPVFDVVHLYHHMLVAEGWNVLVINSRGSDGYGEDWYRAVVGGWGRRDLPDFMCAVDALVEEGAADPERLSLTGYSYGGFMTNWIIAHTNRFSSAIAGGCLSNLTSSFGSCDKGWLFGSLEMGVSHDEDPEVFTELSPLTHVDRVSTPTLVLHGRDDDRCPVGQAEEWFAALRSRGRTVELVLYPGASHLFLFDGRPSQRIDYARRVAAWAKRFRRREGEAAVVEAEA
ncbi:MAG: S9 family peptidase [Actinomycetota bacterium]